ncbi:hypothetical protein [Terracoccus sp. 273MFTsu3.1]|uniref:hypothetical protein n=1 Tax=Terracoccus sp. 273MFTsu3.1 TaxID=1172188 RepID=UPI00036FE7E9|nr:hypothetical protein [Terracoccus sp. 273MFTsu3.1]
MTVQPEATTYSHYSPFPSEPENHFRAIKGEVFTDNQQFVTQIDIAYQIGFAGQVTSVRLNVAVDTDEHGVPLYDGMDEVNAAKADLEFMHQHWIEFYAAAKSALEEIPSAA